MIARITHILYNPLAFVNHSNPWEPRLRQGQARAYSQYPSRKMSARKENMKRLLIAGLASTAFAFCSPLWSTEAFKPSVRFKVTDEATHHGRTERINGSCNAPFEKGDMLCNLTFSTLSYSPVADEVPPYLEDDLLEMHAKTGGDPNKTKEECAKFPKPPPSQGNLRDAFRKRLLDGITTYCKDGNMPALREIIRSEKNNKSNYCTVSVFPMEPMLFAKKSQNKWEHTTKPNVLCGEVFVFTLENKPGKWVWSLTITTKTTDTQSPRCSSQAAVSVTKYSYASVPEIACNSLAFDP